MIADKRKKYRDDGNADVVELEQKEQHTLFQNFSKRNALTQNQFDSCILEYLAEDFRPFHKVKAEGFRKFVTRLAPGLTVKTIKSFQTKCSGLFATHKQLLDDLKAA